MIPVKVIGAGLAGCEAAWQLAQRGVKVELFEMKPAKMSPAHHSADFAELVCSNSLRGDRLENAVGLLKEELRRAGSLILACADATRVEAGGCLAVDRGGFSAMITEKIRSHPNITVVSGEVTEILEREDMVRPAEIEKKPYDRGTADYINCGMNAAEYSEFVRELAAAEEAPVHGFEDKMVFEGCMPVEVMARRGPDTLRYGPMKPVGLRDPATGKEPYAVVQLRRDNAAGSIYNIVGFQTHLRFPEQKRVFSMIPALHDAEFVRYGVMHRNTFLRSPGLLDRVYADLRNPMACFAGQLTGVEGYVESTASGLLAALGLYDRLCGREPRDFTRQTAIGALGYYVSDPSVANFQPMNINFSIISPLGYKVRGKKEKNLAIAQRALDQLAQVLAAGLETGETL